jgi:hypothetical protein
VDNYYVFGNPKFCLASPSFGTCNSYFVSWTDGYQINAGLGGFRYGHEAMGETAAWGASGGTANRWNDSTSHRYKFNFNGGDDLTIPGTVAQGTSVLGTSAIGSGNCATAITTAATNTTTLDVVNWSFQASPTTSWAGLTVQAYPTSGNVNFLVCNPTTGSLTPGATTLNWKVLR